MFDSTSVYSISINNMDYSDKIKTEFLVDSIKHHLEKLLNTRCDYFNPTLETFELDNSSMNYGLPDLRYFNLGSKNDIKKLCQIVETVIETHESRLKNVRVSLVESKFPEDLQQVLLCIKATLFLNTAEKTEKNQKEIEFFSEFNRISQLFLVRDL